MERALKTEPYDILIDYAHDADLLQQQRRDADSDSGLKLESTLFSNTLTKNRTVTSLDWSTKV